GRHHRDGGRGGAARAAGEERAQPAAFPSAVRDRPGVLPRLLPPAVLDRSPGPGGAPYAGALDRNARDTAVQALQGITRTISLFHTSRWDSAHNGGAACNRPRKEERSIMRYHKLQ